MFKEKRSDFTGYKAEVVSPTLPREVFMALQKVASGDAYMQER